MTSPPDNQDTPPAKASLWALSPLLVFFLLYLVISIAVQDFYAVPVTVAFMAAAVWAVFITRGKSMAERVDLFSSGVANRNILMMVWIFVLAGALAQSARDMGAIDATVQLTLRLLPDNLLFASVFIASCFISLSVGTSVGTIVALAPTGHAGQRRHDDGHCGGGSILRRQSFLHFRHHDRRHPYAGLRHAGQIPS